MKCINLKSYLKLKIYHKTLVHGKKIQKKTTLIVLSTELHLSKRNESHQLFVLGGGGIAASCLATMNWKMLVSRKLGIPSLNMVVCSFVSFYIDIPHVHGDF